MMKRQPNMIYILADDMGYGDISCLNDNSKINTPNLDRLGKEGIIFTDAHSSSAVCTPSRYSILTGRYNWRSALKEGVLGGYSRSIIEQGRMTVADLLKQAGYYTACFGKWHLGLDWQKSGDTPAEVDFSKPIQNGPSDLGFDEFYGISASLDMPPYVYIENDKATQLPDQVTRNDDKKGFWREGPTAPDFRHEEVLPRLTQKVLDRIEQFGASSGSEPFFIYYPLPAPHTPILPTADFKGKSGTNLYGDFVLMCDDVIGLIMSKLESCGLADNTILVFTSDNGCSPSADYGELARVGHNPSYVFRGHKADIYEGGHRIPLLVRWPAQIAAGTIIEEPVCLVDFMATAADIAGLPLPDNAGEDSVSQLPLWLGQAREQPLREAIVHHSIDGSFSIRKGEWKLELCPGSGGWSDPMPGAEPEGTPSFQLYRLSEDIGERHNLAERHPEVVLELKELLTRYIKDGRSTPGKPQPNTGAPRWGQLHWMQ
ncbi:sulfatase family protein [Paenibacillus apiarius]|uniref:sulfatase family protein n=1 Tax=Paenibacillus apiarius TaxID=46240 RepID=UPI00197E31B5|nr:arylsulfatase [Paenibacillus apiarius]MBN3522964.1 arylsulfatase [Paenibacillus apiarius]